MRDLTNQQFRESISRHNIKPVGFLGYYDIGNGISVSRYNGGEITTNRALLAYLLRRQEEECEATSGR